MLTKKQKKAIERICYRYYKSLNSTHNVWHMKNTVRLAVYIAKKEKANIEICKYAAMLHQYHDAKRVDKIVKKLKTDDKTRRELVHCVYCATSKTINKAKTLEAKVINDADKLQCLGVIGIMRQMHDFSIRWGLKRALEKGLREQRLYYRLMKTKTAKRLAKEHYEYGVEFYKNAMRTIR